MISQNFTLLDKRIDRSVAHQHRDKPDEYDCPYEFGYIRAWITDEGAKSIKTPVCEVFRWKCEAIEWPEESSRDKPHLI